MDYRGCGEIKRERVVPQVVLVPASALRVFVRMALASRGPGVFWELGAHRVDKPSLGVKLAFSGPHMRPEDIPNGSGCVHTTGPWGEMISAARNIPVWAAAIAERTTLEGERWLPLSAELVRGLVAPAYDPLWDTWHVASKWVAPLVIATHSLLECELIFDELAEERAIAAAEVER